MLRKKVGRIETTMMRPRVAFQGERGAFSEEAAEQLLGEIEPVPRATFEALFSAIAEGAADYALAPIENALAGSVHRSYDLLLESGLHVIGETILPIALCLIGLPDSSLDGITSVASHPVALAQCENFFRARPAIRREPALDTAGSVREMTLRKKTSHAAIAAQRAAKIYGAKVLMEHVEDNRENYTRFLLLAAAPELRADANKLSLVLELAHRPGALHSALDAFARRGINLLKIESRPIPGSPWHYRFYLDLHASLHDKETAAALEELRACADNLRVLGCYPAHSPE